MPTRPDDAPLAVSVLLPTRDRPDSIGRVLAALSAQDVEGLDPELVVVDNGSADPARARVQELVGRHPWPARVVDEPRPGAAAARNAAVRHARHDVLVFLNDDIVPAGTHWLRGHADVHRRAADPVVGVLGPVTWHPDVDATPAMRWLGEAGKFNSYTRVARGETTAGEVYASNLSLHRALYEAAGGFDVALDGYGWEEYDLALRLCDQGLVLRFDAELVAWHHHRYDLRQSLAREEELGASSVRFTARHPRRAGLDTPSLPGWAVRIGGPAYAAVRRVPLPEALPPAALRWLHRVALAHGIARARREAVPR